MTKPLKSRPKVESTPEFGNSLEVESKAATPERNGDTPGGRNTGEAGLAAESRAFEFEDDEEDEGGAARLAAMPLDDRYEEIKRGEIHIAELQRMTMQQVSSTMCASNPPRKVSRT